MRGERRRWTDATKRMIVAECEVAGVSAASVARRYKISAQHLALWRRDPRFNGAQPGPAFYPVTITDDEDRAIEERLTPLQPRSDEPRGVEIQFPCGAKILCPDEASLVMVVRAVRRA